MALIRKYQTAGEVENTVFKDELRSDFSADDVANSLIRNGSRFANLYLKGKRRENLLNYLHEGVKLVREGKISRNAQGLFEVPEGASTTEYYDSKRKKIVANDNTTRKDFFAYLGYVLDHEKTLADKKTLGIANPGDKKLFSIDDYLYKVAAEHQGNTYDPSMMNYNSFAMNLASSLTAEDRIKMFLSAIRSANYDELSKSYTFEGDLKNKEEFDKRMKEYANLLDNSYTAVSYRKAHTGLNGKIDPLHWYGSLSSDNLSYIDPEAKEEKPEDKPGDTPGDTPASDIQYNYNGTTYTISGTYDISKYDKTKAGQIFSKLRTSSLSYNSISSFMNGSDKTNAATASYILQQYYKSYPTLFAPIENNWVLLPWTLNGSGDSRRGIAFHVTSGTFKAIDYASGGPKLRAIFDRYSRSAKNGMKVPKFQNSGQFYWNTVPRGTKAYSNVAWASNDASGLNEARWTAFKLLAGNANTDELKQEFVEKFNDLQTQHGMFRELARTASSGNQYSEGWQDKVSANEAVRAYQDKWVGFANDDYLNNTIINPFRSTRYRSTTTGNTLGMDTALSPSDGLFGAITDDRRFWRDDEDVSAYTPEIEKMGMSLFKDEDGYYKLKLNKPAGPADDSTGTDPDGDPGPAGGPEDKTKPVIATPGTLTPELKVKQLLSGVPLVNLAKLFTGLTYNRDLEIAWREPYKEHILNTYRIVGDYGAKTRAESRGQELLRTVADNLGADTRDNLATLLSAQDKYGDYVERGNLIDSAALSADYDAWLTGRREDHKDDRDVAYVNATASVDEMNTLIEGRNKKKMAEAKMWDNYLSTLATDIAANDAIRRKALYEAYPRTLNDIYTQAINNATSDTERAILREEWAQRYLESLGKVYSSNPYLVGQALVNRTITGPLKKKKKGGSLTYEERANLLNARETNKALREARKDTNKGLREGNKIVANHLKPKRRRR